jgi:hypothetical protein
VAAGAVDQLYQAVAGPEPLHVVLVAVQYQPGVSAKRAPERIDVGVVAVHGAGAEARPMPEGEPAVPWRAQLRAQPPELPGAAVMRDLRVKRQDLPAAGPEGVVGRWAHAARLRPVGDVALATLRPIVVARGRRGDATQRPERRRVALAEPLAVALRVDVPEIQEQVGTRPLHQSRDGHRPRPTVGAVARRPHERLASRAVGNEEVPACGGCGARRPPESPQPVVQIAVAATSAATVEAFRAIAFIAAPSGGARGR